MKTKANKIFSLSVLVLCIAVFGLVSAASADYTEDSIEEIMDAHYGAGNWTENTITEITFVPQSYTVVTIVVDEHQAGYVDPTGWYSVANGANGSLHQLFSDPSPGESTTFNPGEEFGLYINSTDGRFYSQQSLNPDGEKHARVFTVTAGAKQGAYVVAFEDLINTKWGGVEPDYNDVVVELTGEGLELIPEFTTIAIPIAAILGLLFFYNHRKRKEE